MQPLSNSVFLVFGNAKDGQDEALDRWYMDVHGPDSFDAGVFSALHRYRAVGDYPARHLTVWESAFDTVDEARTRVGTMANELRARGRVGDPHEVVRGAVYFADGGTDPVPFGGTGDDGTLTLVEGPLAVAALPVAAGDVHHYGPLLLAESPDDPADAAARWASVGEDGIAPVTVLFGDQPDPRDGWSPAETPWVSHWRRTGTARAH